MSSKDKAIILLKRALANEKRIIIGGLVFIGLLAVVWVAIHLNWEMIFSKDPDPVPVMVQPVRYEYEIPVDSFDNETIRIRSDQFLSEILLERGVSMATIDRLAKEFMYVFDLRKMKAGNRLKLYYTPDTLHQLQYMIYEKNASEYVVYNFRDSLQVSLKRKEIKTEICYMEAEIAKGSSIWQAVKDQGVNDEIVSEIVSVYQWMIDAYSIKPGDRFEVIFENQTVNNVSIGAGKVLAARFMYSKKWFEAYNFEQNGISSYFNQKGESLRRAFLKAPLDPKSFRISSGFSGSRMHPILRIRRPHYGVDYAAPSGTPVVSIGDGKVIQRSFDRGSGNMLKIKHNAAFTTGYMHLKGYASGISAGSVVRQGQVIGYVGATGLATGPHLDFRIWQNGKPVDPLKVESPPVEPVDPKLRPVYDSIVKSYQNEFVRYKKSGLSSVDNF
ncbi:MAG: peptidoglycan DD-metalloendopeptidase family protein [Bacteroidales bacterium]